MAKVNFELNLRDIDQELLENGSDFSYNESLVSIMGSETENFDISDINKLDHKESDLCLLTTISVLSITRSNIFKMNYYLKHTSILYYLNAPK